MPGAVRDLVVNGQTKILLNLAVSYIDSSGLEEWLNECMIVERAESDEFCLLQKRTWYRSDT